METILNMKIGTLISGAAGIIIILSTIIEITPIKINPISWFLGWVGKRTNGELSKQVKELDTKVASLESEVQDMKCDNAERDAVACRIRILRFGDEIRRGMKHSQDSFDQVLADMDNYDKYCNDHPAFKNNKTIVTQKRIREEYANCLEQNDFL